MFEQKTGSPWLAHRSRHQTEEPVSAESGQDGRPACHSVAEPAESSPCRPDGEPSQTGQPPQSWRCPDG